MFFFRLRHLFVFSICFLIAQGCTKIDTTKLGGGLIPEVDNVFTFDTTLDVVTNNFIFDDDSTKLSASDLHGIGEIVNDPIFGKTSAKLFFEMKPLAGFPFKFTDSLITNLDSVVLSLRFNGTYGDTLTPIKFSVYAIKDSLIMPDTTTAYYTVNRNLQPNGFGIKLGEKTISPTQLKNDSISIYRSSTLSYKAVTQIRIPFSANTLFDKAFISDTATQLKSDSLFRVKHKGFAVVAENVSSPGSICYFTINDTASKLEFYYRRKNNTGIDTTSGIFVVSNQSGHANYVKRDRSGAEINSHLTTPATGDSLLYLYTSPGSYAKISIPGLTALSNRIIHRAEIKLYQIPGGAFNGILTPPPFLYAERFDTGTAKKLLTIPYDLNPDLNAFYGNCFPTNGIDYGYFGGFPKQEMVNGQLTSTFFINISRYVQQVVTTKTGYRDLRLSHTIFSQYDGCGVASTPIRVTANRIAEGRVKIGGGAKPGSTWPYKMKVRIIYSKI